MYIWKTLTMNNYFLAKDNPKSIIEQYPTLEEFENYLSNLPIVQLKYKLIDFEGDELYSHCAIIQKVLTEKINCIVTRID